MYTTSCFPVKRVVSKRKIEQRGELKGGVKKAKEVTREK
jgi:hypothetical protein